MEPPALKDSFPNLGESNYVVQSLETFLHVGPKARFSAGV